MFAAQINTYNISCVLNNLSVFIYFFVSVLLFRILTFRDEIAIFLFISIWHINSQINRYSLYFCYDNFLLFFNTTCFYCTAGNVGVDQHIEQGKQLLSLGKLPESLEHFTAAIGTFSFYLDIIFSISPKYIGCLFSLDAEPGNYLHYFRRATIFLGMNRPLPALHDLSHSITLNPRFVGVRYRDSTISMNVYEFLILFNFFLLVCGRLWSNAALYSFRSVASTRRVLTTIRLYVLLIKLIFFMNMVFSDNTR